MDEIYTEPTPLLGKPNSRNKMFTKSENALLDQITLEITEAWSKDLKVMRKVNKTSREAQIALKKSMVLLKNKIELLDSYLNTDNGIPKLGDILKNQNEIFSYISDVRKEILEFSNRLNYPYIAKIKEDIEKIQITLKQIQQEKSKKKWWQLWI